MIFFANDYSEIAHPKVLNKLNQLQNEQNHGYGLDKHSEGAKKKIKQLLGSENIDVHFVSGGTQANLITLKAMLKPYEAIISCRSGHIYTSETGAIEATGHKILTVEGVMGKLTPLSIEKIIKEHKNEHMVKPRVVFISNATELGTIYTYSELQALKEACLKHNLLFYLDGARIANALVASDNDVNISDLVKFFDAFYLGGTKNGAMFGEVIVLVNDKLKENFRYHIKQRGGLLAKGFTLGAQFEVLFTDNLYFDIAKHANRQANKIRRAIENKGLKCLYKTTTNQIFIKLNHAQYKKLSEDFVLTVWEENEEEIIIRIVTSFATTNENVELLIKGIESL